MEELHKNNNIFFDRIEQIIDLYGIKNVNEFALNHLGYKSSQKINRLKNPETSPSFDILNDISNKFENINTEWLLTGKGDMLNRHPYRQDTPSNQVAEPQAYYGKAKPYGEQKKNVNSISLYEVNNATDLQILLNKDQNSRIIDTLYIPNLPECDGALFLVSDTMYPLMKPRDIILYRKVHNTNYLQFGSIYLLAYTIGVDKYWTVRYIQRSEINAHIKLVAYNEQHQPLDIPSSSIEVLALVVASIQYNVI